VGTPFLFTEKEKVFHPQKKKDFLLAQKIRKFATAKIF